MTLMDKKKICLINLDLGIGGAQRFISNLANFLSEEGYIVDILLLHDSPVLFKIHKNIKIWQPQFSYTKSTYRKIKYLFQLVSYIRHTLKKINPDIVFNTAAPSFILCSTVGLSYPIYLSIRCNPFNTKLIEILNIPLSIRRFLYKRSKGIIAQTSFASDVLKKQMHHSNVIVIPNALGEKQYYNYEKKNQIISVGRLVQSKGFDYLIKVFAQVYQPGWKLLIVGDGPEKDNLQSLITCLEITEYVELAGSKSNIGELLSQSSIFAFTSLTEGFPNALLEAMGTPLPCISFDCQSGPADMIKDGENGYLVPLKDTEGFSKKLSLLIRDKNLREHFMQQAKKTSEKYNQEAIGAIYLRSIFENETEKLS